MRVLHFTNSVDLSGGVKQLLLLMEGIRETAADAGQALVCPPQGAVFELFRRRGFKVYGNRVFQDYDIFSAWRLKRIIEGEGFDIVHAHHSMAHAVSLVARHLSRFHLIVSRRVTHRIPFYPTSTFKYCSAKIDAFICVSEAVKEVLAQRGVQPQKLTVVPSSTDLAVFKPRAPSPRLLAELNFNDGHGRSKPFIFGVLANYSAWKGHDLFLEAFHLLQKRIAQNGRHAVAILAGRDTDSDKVKNKLQQWQLDQNVRLLGWREDADEVLAAFDVLVCPSLEGEGSSGVIREAMAMGISVLASDIAANQLLAGNGRGWLFKAGDASSFAAAMFNLLETKKDEREQKVILARQFAQEHFGVPAMVAQTLALYRRVMVMGSGFI